MSDDSGKHEDINSETADIFFTMPDENITVSAKYRAMTNGVILSQDNLTFEVEQIRSESRWNLLEGKWYYFNPVSDDTRGALYINRTTPDGYAVGADGVWQS